MAEASAPASSANLGPGFDVLALALEIRCTVEAEESDRWIVEHHTPQTPPPGAVDAVLAAARCAVGEDRPLRLQVENNVPIGKGLGSSSAAYAAGALAAWRTVGESHPDTRLFDLVCELEGHPDNAAAAVYGGMVLTCNSQVHHLPWRDTLHPVVAVPDRGFPTRQARAVLPESYPAEVVVRTIGRTGLLIAGLLTGDQSMLQAAAGDEIHEAPRSRVRPEVAALIDRAREAGAAHASWSGAGPSVLALATADAVDEVEQALRKELEGEGVVLLPAVATTGTV